MNSSTLPQELIPGMTEVINHIEKLEAELEEEKGINCCFEELEAENKKLKEELEESEKEKGQMANNGGFCGDPETSECANAMFWRMGRDRMKSLEEENKKLKEKVKGVAELHNLAVNMANNDNARLQEEIKKLEKEVSRHRLAAGNLDEENKKLQEELKKPKDLSHQDIRVLVEENFHGEGMGRYSSTYCIYDWYTDFTSEESEEECDSP